MSLISQINAGFTAVGVYAKGLNTRLLALEAGPTGYGQEMAYAELTTDFTSTNTSLYSVAAGSIISGLSVTVSGTGRSVDLEFQCPIPFHSVANTTMGVYFIENGAARTELITHFSPLTTIGPTMLARKRITIASGASKTYQVGVVALTAGTQTWSATTGYPMTLSVVGR